MGYVALFLALSLPIVASGAVGTTLAEDLGSEEADLVCYRWIDGNWYCCEFAPNGDIKCAVPPRPASAVA